LINKKLKQLLMDSLSNIWKVLNKKSKFKSKIIKNIFIVYKNKLDIKLINLMHQSIRSKINAQLFILNIF